MPRWVHMTLSLLYGERAVLVRRLAEIDVEIAQLKS